MKDARVSKLALSGIFLAITEVFLLGASIVPGIEMSMLAVATAVSSFLIIETGIKNGVVFYIAATLLGLVILPNKIAIIPYAMFFGLYPVVKYFAEKLKTAPMQLTVKLSYFAVVLAVAFFLLFDIFFGNISLPEWIPVYAIIPVSLIIFLIFDAALTAIINIYFKRIHSRFTKNHSD